MDLCNSALQSQESASLFLSQSNPCSTKSKIVLLIVLHCDLSVLNTGKERNINVQQF